jgi:L-iditol 2-dehydrogenase
MSAWTNEAVYVKSPWQFSIRKQEIALPGPGQMLLEIAACAVCGTDLHIADRMTQDWQVFGHEVAGVVLTVGEGVTRFAPGDRVALDSSAPCGRCATCLPRPYGRNRPDLCPKPTTYYGSSTMGFGRLLITPYECAVPVPPGMPAETACLVEPLGVSLDLVQTAEINPGDHVLVIGPGPLGLGAVFLARQAGAAYIWLAGRSRSRARLEAGSRLGADECIHVDEQPLSEYKFGARRPDKILITAPPPVIPEALQIAAFGATVAYIGIAWGPGAQVTFDADAFHFRKLSLRASHASPGTHAAECIRILAQAPELGTALVSHRFDLADIGSAMLTARDDRVNVVKMVMVQDVAGWR